MSLCCSVLASIQTLHHMEAQRRAASFDSHLPFLSVIRLRFVYFFSSLSAALSFYLQYTFISLWRNTVVQFVTKMNPFNPFQFLER